MKTKATKTKQSEKTKHSNEDYLYYNTQQDENEFRNSLMFEVKNNQSSQWNDQFSLYNQNFN